MVYVRGGVGSGRRENRGGARICVNDWTRGAVSRARNRVDLREFTLTTIPFI